MKWKEYVSFTKRERNGVITLVVLILLIAVAPELFPKASVTASDAKGAGEKIRKGRTDQSTDMGHRYNRKFYSGYGAKPGEEDRYPDDGRAVNANGLDFRGADYPYTENAIGGYRYHYRQRKNDGREENVGYRNADGYSYNKFERSGYGKKEDSRYRDQNKSTWRTGDKSYYRKENKPVWATKDNKFYRSENKLSWPTKDKLNWPLKSNSFRKIEVMDINKADTAAFIALPGIGGKLAARIVLFRGKLGGFIRVEQVREIYGLTDSTYSNIAKWLACKPEDVQKININNAQFDELARHPYLRGNIAAALLSYRKQHGVFQSLSDLGKIQSLQPSDLEKILPYLSVN